MKNLSVIYYKLVQLLIVNDHENIIQAFLDFFESIWKFFTVWVHLFKLLYYFE